MYVAESLEDSQQKYVYQGDFGEAVEFATRPIIVYFNIAKNVFETIPHIPKIVSVGQVDNLIKFSSLSIPFFSFKENNLRFPGVLIAKALLVSIGTTILFPWLVRIVPTEIVKFSLPIWLMMPRSFSHLPLAICMSTLQG
jgi:hypothetical protein